MIPIPRISWGDGYTITEDVNDRLPLSFYPGVGGAVSGYVGQIPAGSYATPEALIAAIVAAVESEPSARSGGPVLFGDESSINGSMPDGKLSASSLSHVGRA